MLAILAAAKPPILTPYYSIILWVFIIEAILVILLGSMGIGMQWYLRKQRERNQSKRTHFKQLLMQYTEKNETALGKSFLSSFRGEIPWLLSAISDVNQSIDPEKVGSAWEKVRQNIGENILLPKGRKLAFRRRWTQQLTAVRCFAMYPKVEDETPILHLLKQKVPIIKFTAAHAAARLGTPKAFEALLEAMNQATHYLRQPYIDALRKSGDKAYQYLEHKLETETNPLVRVSCLEVLSDRMNEHIARLLEPDLKSPHKNLKIAAARALGHYPDFSSTEALLPLLSDPAWEVKAISARSLGYIKASRAVKELAATCQDPTWWVRMNAALALKRIGSVGIEKLEALRPETDRFAYEIAQYVLALPE